MTYYNVETANARFDEFGYSRNCEFVMMTDKKRGMFLTRCKTCGYEFERHTNILRKPQKELRCPKCHEQKVTAALEYYESGHSRYECAEKFGLTPNQVQGYVQMRGVRGGWSQEKRGEFGKASQKKATAKSAEITRGQSEIRANDRRIRKEFNELSSELDKWRKLLNELHVVSSRKNKRLARIVRNIDGLETYEPKIATCKHCGKEWLFWPSHEKWGRRCSPKYCSQKCFNRHNNTTKDVSVRLRRHGRGDEYRESITLDEVIERDGGICYLCGCETSKDDCWYDVNGYHVCGDTYPTRDHVIPIARGGTHTWDNVRLACRRCNSQKNDRTLEEYLTATG